MCCPYLVLVTSLRTWSLSVSWCRSAHSTMFCMEKLVSTTATAMHFWVVVGVCLRCLVTWLGIGKSIRPVNIWVMRCWYLSGARCWLFAYGPADATANPKTQLSFASFKSKLVLPFWYQLNTRTLCVFDDRLVTHSSVVFGGQARIVYDTLVYQIFTAWCYMLCIWAIEHLWHAISRKRLEIGIYFCWHEKQEITSSIQWHRF